MADRHQIYRENNREKLRLKSRREYEANKEAIKARHKEYYQKNKEAIAEQKLLYRRDHEDEIREQQRQWRKNNAEKFKIKKECELCGRMVRGDGMKAHHQTRICQWNRKDKD